MMKLWLPSDGVDPYGLSETLRSEHRDTEKVFATRGCVRAEIRSIRTFSVTDIMSSTKGQKKKGGMVFSLGGATDRPRVALYVFPREGCRRRFDRVQFVIQRTALPRMRDHEWWDELG